MMDLISLRTCSFAAAVMPAVFVMLWIASAGLDGHWTLGTDSLSRMGISDNAVSAALFNGGCIVTGAVGILIGIGMMRCEQGLNTYAGISYAIGMFFLMMVGVFNMSMETPHYVVASAFACFMLVSMAIVAVTSYYEGWHPVLDIVLIIVAVALVLTQEFAVWEAADVGIILVWTEIQGRRMVIHGGSFPLRDPLRG